MWAGRGLRVSLKAKCWLVNTSQALQAAVKKADMGGAKMGWQGCLIDGKTVVLTCDGNTTAVLFFDRMVGTVVAKFHFEGFGTTGQGHDLVA